MTIQRITMFKVHDDADVEPILEQYKELEKNAQKVRQLLNFGKCLCNRAYSHSSRMANHTYTT